MNFSKDNLCRMVFLVFIVCFSTFLLNTQVWAEASETTTIVLQPGPEVGIDTKLNGYGAYDGGSGYMIMNFGAADRMTVGSSRYAWSGPERSMIEFDFDELGVSGPVKVISAELAIYPYEVNGDHDHLWIFALKRGWGEGSGDARNAVTGEAAWFYTRYPNEWDAPGANAPGLDRSHIPMGTTHENPVENDWWSIRFNKFGRRIIESWINKDIVNNGMLLIGDERRGLRSVYFYSSDVTDPALRPKLTLEIEVIVDD